MHYATQWTSRELIIVDVRYARLVPSVKVHFTVNYITPVMFAEMSAAAVMEMDNSTHETIVLYGPSSRDDKSFPVPLRFFFWIT